MHYGTIQVQKKTITYVFLNVNLLFAVHNKQEKKVQSNQKIIFEVI